MKLYAFLRPVSGSRLPDTFNLVMISILLTTSLGGIMCEPLDNAVLEPKM